MAKANIPQYDSTPSNNSDINSINIAESCPASNINNAIRELMAHLKDMDTGTTALTSPSFTAMSTDTISEKTSANGVAIDSVTLKDGELGTIASPVPINSSSLNGGQFGGRRNIIINGNMKIFQRFTTKALANANSYVPDRFECAMQTASGQITFSQSTDVPSGEGFTNSTKINVDTANTSLASSEHNLFQQKIEGHDLARLGWGSSGAKNCTISFWIKSSLTGTFSAYLLDANANSQSYVHEFTISSANTWQKISYTVTAPTSGGATDFSTGNGIGCFVGINLGCGTNQQTSTLNSWHATSGTFFTSTSSSVKLIGTASANMYVTGFQMEMGSVATPFEHLSFSETLNLCQRFFQKSYNYGDAIGNTSNSNGSNAFQIDDGAIQRDGVRLVKSMRANPTIVIYNPVSGSSASVRTNAGGNHSASSFSQGENGFFVDYTPNTGEFLQFHHTADAEL